MIENHLICDEIDVTVLFDTETLAGYGKAAALRVQTV